MSRVDDYEEGENFPNEAAMWHANVERALKGKRGRQALADLREALLALPRKRLIEGFLGVDMAAEEGDQTVVAIYVPALAEGQLGCFGDPLPSELTAKVGIPIPDPKQVDFCAVGALIWWRRVKAGEDPEKVVDSLDGAAEDDMHETAYRGMKEAGLRYTLAWALAYRNDEDYGDETPEGRYTRFLAWVEKQLASV